MAQHFKTFVNETKSLKITSKNYLKKDPCKVIPIGSYNFWKGAKQYEVY